MPCLAAAVADALVCQKTEVSLSRANLLSSVMKLGHVALHRIETVGWEYLIGR